MSNPMEDLLHYTRRAMLSEGQKKKSSGRVEAECQGEAQFDFYVVMSYLMS
jgi:hypothetical protein